MEELKIQTQIGEMTGVFQATPVGLDNVYTAWFKEKPSVIVQADSISEAIEELQTSLKIMLEIEKEEKWTQN